MTIIRPTLKSRRLVGESFDDHVRRVFAGEPSLSYKEKVVMYVVIQFEHEGIIPSEEALFNRCASLDCKNISILHDSH